jgi:N-acetylglutamate synthase-like GNAT family acetyltransferase
MEDIIIREAEIDDINQIHWLQQQWQQEDITFGFACADKEYLTKKLGKYFLVAERKGQVVGFAYGSVSEAHNLAVFKDGEKYIEIEDIYLIPENRHTQIGSALVDRILELAKEDGISRSLVYSATKDSDGILIFYKQQGYKTWYVQMFK